MSIFTRFYNWLFDPNRTYRILGVLYDDKWLSTYETRRMYRDMWKREMSAASLLIAAERLEGCGLIEMSWGEVLPGTNYRRRLLRRTEKGKEEFRLWMKRTKPEEL